MQYSFLKFSIFIALLFLFSGCYQDVTDVQNGDDDEPDNGDTPAEFSHTNAPGDSNKDLVTDQDFENLIIEVQYMPGTEPEDESLDNLVAFLSEHLQKSDISILEPQQINSLNQNYYTTEELQEIEEQNREVYSNESTLAVYLLFVDGTFFGEEFEDPTRLGISTYNTSTAYFGETIDRISGPLQFDPSKVLVESNTMQHQFGHLMGLVNLTAEMVDGHQDTPNGFHCTIQECLMHFRVNSTEYFSTQFNEAVPALDDFCFEDLNALKE